MDREQLERPFDRSLIKTRKGALGQQLAYVEGVEFIKRLNEALDGQWTFEIVEHHVRETEVVVLGKLTADDVTKMAFGGSSITVSREGEVISIADDLKAAATDALKKAASLLGVGLHLYSSERPTEASAGNGASKLRSTAGASMVRSVVASRIPRSDNGRGNGNGRRRGAAGASNGNRLTQRQLSAIWSMGRSLGLSADQIRERTTEAYGVQPEHLSKADASSFITELGEGLSSPAS